MNTPIIKREKSAKCEATSRRESARVLVYIYDRLLEEKKRQESEKSLLYRLLIQVTDVR
jgi:hypothetical protein